MKSIDTGSHIAVLGIVTLDHKKQSHTYTFIRCIQGEGCIHNINSQISDLIVAMINNLYNSVTKKLISTFTKHFFCTLVLVVVQFNINFNVNVFGICVFYVLVI